MLTKLRPNSSFVILPKMTIFDPNDPLSGNVTPHNLCSYQVEVPMRYLNYIFLRAQSKETEIIFTKLRPNSRFVIIAPKKTIFDP